MEGGLARRDVEGCPRHSQSSLEPERRISLMMTMKMPRNFDFFRVFAICSGIGSVLSAAEFVAPAEGPIAFRRDQVPLDQATMAEISKILGTLAKGLETKGATELRGAAQMLALATALDPSNVFARELITNLESGTHQPVSNPEEIAKYQAKIWQYIGWLETPEAGPQGQALAACLSDIITISDPIHPRAAQLQTAGERGAWNGWVASTAAFEAKPIAELNEPSTTDPAEPLVESNAITLQEARVSTPLWRKIATDEPTKWQLVCTPLQMTVKPSTTEEGAPAEFSLVIRQPETSEQTPQLAISLMKLLEKHHGTPPRGRSVRIFSNAKSATIPSESISAAVAVLGSAAITGREPNATILGKITPDEAFEITPEFWNQLRDLPPGDGTRLILPTAATSYLSAFLALEKPQFFFDYEVMLASNFRELLELSAKNQDAPMAGISTKFQEIHGKIGNQKVGQYVANPHIRRRLAELSNEAPNHASAKMLATQAAGNRPTEIPQAVLVSELQSAISPIASIVDGSFQLWDPDRAAQLDKLSSTYDTCRTKLEAIARYARKEDKDLIVKVREMVVLARTLDRAARARGEPYLVRQAFENAHTALIRSYRLVSEELANLAGNATMRTPKF